MLNHKEMTAHIRKRIKQAGVKARVNMYTSCGTKYIHVYTVGPSVFFNEEEQFQIRLIAQVNGLTRARGSAIDLHQMTDPRGAHFEYHSRTIACVA